MFKEHLTKDHIGDEKDGYSGEERGRERVRGRGRGGKEKGELCQVKADVDETRIEGQLSNLVQSERKTAMRSR
jgi:hypothetical protein